MRLLAVAFAFLFGLTHVARAEEQFKEFEVRVIKNKFFQKRLKLELSGYGAVIPNKSFTYNVMGGGALGFHITESFALYGDGMYGYGFRNGDCNTLGSKFKIEPTLDEVNWFAGGGIAYTPIYGKYQLASGRVIYFDWNFTAGGGIASVLHKEKETCMEKEPLPDPTVSNFTKQRVQVNFGTGQKYFLNQHFSLNWNVKVLLVQPVDTDDFSQMFVRGSNGLLMFGASYFL